MPDDTGAHDAETVGDTTPPEIFEPASALARLMAKRHLAALGQTAPTGKQPHGDLGKANFEAKRLTVTGKRELATHAEARAAELTSGKSRFGYRPDVASKLAGIASQNAKDLRKEADAQERSEQSLDI